LVRSNAGVLLRDRWLSVQPALAIFALAILFRLTLGVVLLNGGDAAFVSASDDGDAYAASARWAASGEPIVLDERLARKWTLNADPAARWPAAYWLFLGGQYRLLGYQHVSTVLIQALLGSAGVLAAYWIARRLLLPYWANVAGVLLAVSSSLVYLSAALYAEALYIPLLLISLALVARANATRAPYWCAAAGLLFGLAEATRPLALPIFLVAVGWTAWYANRHDRPRMLAALLAGFALAVTPFVVRDLLTLGHVALFSVGGTEAFHDHGAGDLSQALAALGVDPYTGSGLATPLTAFLARPGDVALAVASGVPERLLFLFLGGWAPLAEPMLSLAPAGITLAARILFWALVAVGAFHLIRGRQPVAVLVLMAALAIVVPPLVLGLPLVRYRVPADPIFLIWFAAALAWLTHLGHGFNVARAVRPGRSSKWFLFGTL
jgi:hypothetical protein